jgi:excisionase family DNA binding protein
MAPHSQSEQLIGLTEAAERLGVHYMTAYRYVRTGRLAGERVGAQWRVATADVDELLARPRIVAGRGRRALRYDTLLSGRLLAGDEAGAWQVIEEAATSAHRPEEIYLDVIGPAMQQVGDDWATGEVDVVDEHVATVIAYRLIGRLGPRFNRRGRSRGSVVLGAPTGDHHGLPVSLVADPLRGRGFEVVDLGSHAPPESFVAAALRADRLVVVGIAVTIGDNGRAVEDTVHALRVVPEVPIVVGGAARPESLGVIESASARDFLDHVERMMPASDGR